MNIHKWEGKMENEINRFLEKFEKGHITRRQLIAKLGGLVMLLSGAKKGLTQNQNSKSTFEAIGINHIALGVKDVKRSSDFYIKHLGLKQSQINNSSSFLNFGDNFLALFESSKPKMDHYCYSIRNFDVGQVEETLKTQGLKDIHRESGRIYFSDPDGLTVQLASEDHGV
jgi:catechol 2,3-dioxygenase-like lactoylglutathione lyase family enzyme